jgi:uncharacterized protein YndB with AHSA1/START domain
LHFASNVDTFDANEKEANMPDIIHRIGFKAPPAKVYEAVATSEGLSRWWTDEVQGESRPGGRIEFLFRTPGGDVLGKMVMEVTGQDSPRSVRWRCVDGPPDWIGTRFTFDLTQMDGQTILIFGHRGWAEASESMAHCSMKWAVFLLSLKDYVQTGKGKPSPHDLKIDNWN